MRKIIHLLNLLLLFGSGMLNSGILLARVSLDDAAKQAGRSKQRQVLGAKTVRIDGKQVHIIRVLTSDGRVQHLKVDAESGRILGNSGKY